MTDSILSETDWEILETDWEILEIHWQVSEIGHLMDLKTVWILVLMDSIRLLMDLVTGENRLLICWMELPLI